VTLEGVSIGNLVYQTITDVTSSNYSVIANSQTLHFTRARSKPSQSAVSTSGHSPAPRLTSSQAGGHLTPTSYSI
jgi:hypothetical protein